jgi:hypothetical protein
VALETSSRGLEVRAITRRNDSGSSCSPSAVEPVTSAKRTVTILRASRDPVAASSAPHALQKRALSGFAWPQLEHVTTAKAYSAVENAVLLTLANERNRAGRHPIAGAKEERDADSSKTSSFA